MSKLLWISRHPMSNGQRALLPLLGYQEEEQVALTFRGDPVGQIEKLRERGAEIAIVAPFHIASKLLNAGYGLIEFVNVPSARQKGIFVCQGAYRMHLGTIITMEYTHCPLSPEEQGEGDLEIPPKNPRLHLFPEAGDRWAYWRLEDHPQEG